MIKGQMIKMTKLKNVALIACIIKYGDKCYLQIFLQKVLVAWKLVEVGER